MAATKRATARDFQVVPYPEISLEDVYVTRRTLRGVGSKHTSDLALASLAIFVVLTCVVFSTAALGERQTSQSAPTLLTHPVFLAAVLTSAIGAISGMYQIGKQRFSTVDVFSSEIAARIRILAADNSVSRIIDGADPRKHELAAKATADAASPQQQLVEPVRDVPPALVRTRRAEPCRGRSRDGVLQFPHGRT